MPGSIYSPRVVGERRPDFHGLETVLLSPLFAGRQGESLALAFHSCLTSPADGVWHGWPPNERVGEPVGWGDVSDPVKLLNAYGWAICAQNAELLLGLHRAAGLPARIRRIPGHVVCEVSYDGRWHVLDADMHTWFRGPDGTILGVDELAQSPRRLIIDNPSKPNPCSLPDQGPEDYASMYERAGGSPSIFPLWLQATSETGLIALELAGHLEAPACPEALRSTHRWTEDGASRAFTVPPGQASYDLVCGGNPLAHTIEMRAPGSACLANAP